MLVCVCDRHQRWFVDLENMVPHGLELRTLRLLSVRSNQLSYETRWCEWPSPRRHERYATRGRHKCGCRACRATIVKFEKCARPNNFATSLASERAPTEDPSTPSWVEPKMLARRWTTAPWASDSGTFGQRPENFGGGSRWKLMFIAQILNLFFHSLTYSIFHFIFIIFYYFIFSFFFSFPDSFYYSKFYYFIFSFIFSFAILFNFSIYFITQILNLCFSFPDSFYYSIFQFIFIILFFHLFFHSLIHFIIQNFNLLFFH